MIISRGKTSIGPNIVTDDLVLYLDAKNSRSYPGTGSVWYDLSTSSNNWTAAGTYNTDYFTYNNQTTTRSLSTIANNVSGCTIECWYYPVSGGINTGCCDTIFGRYYFRFFQISSNVYTMIGFGNLDGSYNTYQHPAFSIAYDAWHHVIGCRRGNNYIIWIDGVEVYNTTFGSGLILYDVAGGWEISTTNHSNVRIANIKVYNRGLENSEMLQNFNANKKRFGL